MPQSVLHTTFSAALTIFSQLLLSITTIVMTCFNASHDKHHYVFNLSCNSSLSLTLSLFFLFSPCHDARDALPKRFKILLVAMPLLASKFCSRIVPLTSSCRLLDCIFRCWHRCLCISFACTCRADLCRSSDSALMSDRLAPREWASDFLPLHTRTCGFL